MINSSRNSEVSGKPDAECVQKREANAQRTQAYHSRRAPKSPRNRNNKPVNRFESCVHSVFRVADPSKCWEISS